jgi:hypothetical protein
MFFLTVFHMMKKKKGHALEETEEMRRWKREFDEMSLDEHDSKLRNLGLDEEDISEFNESFTGENAGEGEKEGKKKGTETAAKEKGNNGRKGKRA